MCAAVAVEQAFHVDASELTVFVDQNLRAHAFYAYHKSGAPCNIH